MKYTPQHCCSLVPGGYFDFFIVRKMPKVYHPAADVQKSFRINEKHIHTNTHTHKKKKKHHTHTHTHTHTQKKKKLLCIKRTRQVFFLQGLQVSFLKPQLKSNPQFRNANPEKKLVEHVLEPVYSPRAVNTGTCIHCL